MADFFNPHLDLPPPTDALPNQFSPHPTPGGGGASSSSANLTRSDLDLDVTPFKLALGLFVVDYVEVVRQYEQVHD